MSRNIMHDTISDYTKSIGYCAYHKCELTKEHASKKRCRHKLNSRKPCRHLFLYDYKPPQHYRNDRHGVKPSTRYSLNCSFFFPEYSFQKSLSIHSQANFHHPSKLLYFLRKIFRLSLFLVKTVRKSGSCSGG